MVAWFSIEMRYYQKKKSWDETITQKLMPILTDFNFDPV